MDIEELFKEQDERVEKMARELLAGMDGVEMKQTGSRAIFQKAIDLGDLGTSEGGVKTECTQIGNEEIYRTYDFMYAYDRKGNMIELKKLIHTKTVKL